MYRIAVCDDCQADILYISNILKKWADDTSHPIHLESYPSAEAFLFQYEEQQSYDILLLDIEMGQINGMELARKVRQKNRLVQIIFITGYMEYILEGYDVEALHYLLKPVTESKLCEVLTRAADKLKHKEKELYLPAKIRTPNSRKKEDLYENANSMVRIPLYEIRCLEVRKNYVTIYAGETYTVKKTLNELEKELDERFVRTGRSFIVNLSFVNKITKTQVFLKDGSAIPLSRSQYEAVNRAMIQYF